jgi:sigma-B regulation protein RsbU (phosphoserine phosphatase)
LHRFHALAQALRVSTSPFPLPRAPIDAVARSWLSSSAEGFGIWLDGALVEYWPDEATPREPEITAKVPGLTPDFRIGLVGVSGPVRQERLEADAALIGAIARSESDLEAMTAELVDRQDELLTIYEILRSTRSQLDLQVTLRILAREVARILKATHGFAVVSARAGQRWLAASPDGWIGDDEAEALLAKVQASRRDLVAAPEQPRDSTPGFLLVTPVEAQNEVIAALGVARHGAQFSAPDVKLARVIGEQAGAQIENALLHHESLAQERLQAEMRVAAQVQRDLLPRTWPLVAGLDLYATARPASAVGGDFYDVLALGNSRIFLTLGDVTGKGAPAALVMAMTRAALRSAVRATAEADPGSVLRYAIASLYDDFTELGMFATTFIGRFDGPSRELRYVSAGHSPVIHRPAGGPAELLLADEPALGMLDDATAPTRRVALDAGAVVIVATDGFNEARNPDGELFGIERLLASVEAVHDRAAGDIGAALVADVERFQRGWPLDDDQTLLVLKGI